jgi:hypothetical protein
LDISAIRNARQAARLLLAAIAITIAFSSNSFSQPAKNKTKASPRRISFAEAQKLLANELEGNLSKQPGKYSQTRLSSGQVLEVYYPLTAQNPNRKSRTMTVPGYGMLYESEDAFVESTRPHHVLEELIPDGRKLVDDIPALVARLEKRLRVGGGKLDYSRASLKRIDAYLAGYLNSHSTMQTDPQLFQELTAYYGETLRRALGGEWRIRNERVGKTHTQVEPNIAVKSGLATKEIKPWSGIIITLYDEEKRGPGMTRLFDADLRSAQ